MKRKIIAVFCMTVLTSMLATGCVSRKEEKTEALVTVVEEEAKAPADASGEEKTEETEAPEEEKTEETEPEMESGGEVPDESEQKKLPAVSLEDGVYTADFDTDSGMFGVSEACGGKGTLTVEDGRMTIHISLKSKNIVNLFPGLAEDAKKEGAELLSPSTDEVTYSDGITEEVYGFDVPVPVLEEEFDLALLGTKGTWYDHKVSVSNPEKTE